MSGYDTSPAEKHRREAERHLTPARWYSRGPGAATRTEQDRRDAEAARGLVEAFMARAAPVVPTVDDTGARRLAVALSSIAVTEVDVAEVREALERLAAGEGDQR